ncbi:heme NO-binding domain-containing protein [Halorussus gelatinilyticus]|uniref:Heme NO-binding domain-containing protein n=1 Tax=Halorussus gelatinilyticus TaxID=2937524 RepID=A0A8U0IF00_9EURY|nr:heme NO-binding domain-containing protein [Halorussus gelatinilyticus]UPV99477.1 heme NO-binding domain-containing protein [Halorussus gelatinilyticus]
MHGIIFKSLKDFVVRDHGHETWDAVRRAADLDGRVYLPIDTYDDGELIRLAEAVGDETGTPTPDLLEAFGRVAAGQLLDTYGNVVADDWTTLDVVANAEAGIHTVLRAHNPDLDPPELVCRREQGEEAGTREEGEASEEDEMSEGRVRVVYRSPRRLCFVAKGIVRGVADHYGEEVQVTEPTCMHEGADHCELVVTR